MARNTYLLLFSIAISVGFAQGQLTVDRLPVDLQQKVDRMAEAALEQFALTASPEHDAELVRYFHRWTQRQQFLIEGTGAHHESLIHISPQPLTGWN